VKGGFRHFPHGAGEKIFKNRVEKAGVSGFFSGIYKHLVL
jgi:hypothetical protein